MAEQRRIELLSPAKDLECGIAAFDHGADAVYIGAPQFSARSSAGNSLKDIEKLVRYGHSFGARVYVALNTLLEDAELELAAEIIAACHNCGVDAIIVQDMGLLELDLPPIALHASTQVNNRTPEKVRFLEEVGFEQVVLARELSLAEIREIRANTEVSLEFFVHGALCVSYSGQCYISEVVAGRSANRGECAQFCRHRYTLSDGAGKVLSRDRYLLSLQDLNLSARLDELIAAGIDSLKVEGRLKDIGYVKNVTAFYRRQLDRIIEKNPDLRRAASGICDFGFSPAPEKSFNRGTTEYYIDGGRRLPAGIDSPKSRGALVGRVRSCEERYLLVEHHETISNGDGLCYLEENGDSREQVGFQVNRVEPDGAFCRIYSRQRFRLPQATKLYRNNDVQFAKQLKASSGCRRLPVALSLCAKEDGRMLRLSVVDEDGIVSCHEAAVDLVPAQKHGASLEAARRQLVKDGGSSFRVDTVEVELDPGLYYPVALFNDLRRQAFANHLDHRLQSYRIEPGGAKRNAFPWPESELSYLDNITNQSAAGFYRRHGLAVSRTQTEVRATAEDVLMHCRYCVRTQLGLCKGRSKVPAADLFLEDRQGKYRLSFDCARCEMRVFKDRS